MRRSAPCSITSSSRSSSLPKDNPPSMPTTDLVTAAPEIFLTFAICAVLLVDVFLGDHQRNVTYVLSMLALIGTAAVTLYTSVDHRVLAFGGSFVLDPTAGVLKMFTYIIVGVVFLYSRENLEQNGLLKGEFFLLGLFGLLGIMI